MKPGASPAAPLLSVCSLLSLSLKIKHLNHHHHHHPPHPHLPAAAVLCVSKWGVSIFALESHP